MRTLQVGPYAAGNSDAPVAAEDEGTMDVPGIEDPDNVPISVVPTFDDEDDD